MFRAASLLPFLLAALVGCSTSTNAPATAASPTKTVAVPGARAMDFVAKDLQGRTIDLGGLLGNRVVLLAFSTTFCEPCIAELPHLERLYELNKDHGLVVLGIAMDGPETIANVPAFVSRHQVPYPIIPDEDARIASFYNPTRIAPTTVLIDRNGRIVMLRSGYAPGDENELGAAVSRALARPSRDDRSQATATR